MAWKKGDLMHRDFYLDKRINEILAEGREERQSSGRLSASQLGHPVQWQILSAIGIPKKTDNYAFRKFARGKQVEEWIISKMDGVVETQKKVKFMNTVGVIDAIVSHKNWETFKNETIPHEIKSVSNAKFKRIKQTEGADKGHLLQAAFYGLACGSRHFAIDYVSTDDFMVITWIYETKLYKKEIEKIIFKFNECLKRKIVPRFEPKEDWQKKKRYNPYPDFMDLNEKDIIKKLKKEYFNSYKKLLERS